MCDKNKTACGRAAVPRFLLGRLQLFRKLHDDKGRKTVGKIRQLGEYTQTRTKVNKRHKHADKHQRLQMKMDDTGDSRISEAEAMKLEKAFIVKINYLFFCS